MLRRPNCAIKLASLVLLLALTMLLTSCASSTVGYRETAEERAQKEYDLRRKWGAFPRQMPLFDFNKYNIRPDAAKILAEVAGFMKEYPGLQVELQGHCDERGSVEYNMELGDNRAKSAKAFLAAKGIAETRMTTVSYGKSRPLDPGHNEKAWAKNRRIEFAILGE